MGEDDEVVLEESTGTYFLGPQAKGTYTATSAQSKHGDMVFFKISLILLA